MLQGRPGGYGQKSGGGRSPLVKFDTSSRAQLSALQGIASLSNTTSMPAVTRRKSRSRATRRKGSSKVRIVGGRVRLRVAGFSGVQALSPSHLVRHIAASKLKAAAKKVLNKLGKKPARRGRKRKGRKGRKGKKRKAAGRRKK